MTRVKIRKRKDYLIPELLSRIEAMQGQISELLQANTDLEGEIADAETTINDLRADINDWENRDISDDDVEDAVQNYLNEYGTELREVAERISDEYVDVYTYYEVCTVKEMDRPLK